MDALLAAAIAAHGGLERWQRVTSLRLRVRMGGAILLSKVASPRTRVFEAEIETRRVRAVLRPFPKPGLTGIFEPTRVRIEDETGATIADREITHDADGCVSRRLLWDDLDILYFFGYALWNYALTPHLFLWPGFDCREGEPWQESPTERWRRLHVTFPASIPTHCREQTFYFDERGWLRRLDYTADVFSRRARGAHYCFDHRVFDGLVFPTHRVVWWRRPSGRPLRFAPVMKGWVDDVTASARGRQ